MIKMSFYTVSFLGGEENLPSPKMLIVWMTLLGCCIVKGTIFHMIQCRGAPKLMSLCLLLLIFVKKIDFLCKFTSRLNTYLNATSAS